MQRNINNVQQCYRPIDITSCVNPYIEFFIMFKNHFFNFPWDKNAKQNRTKTIRKREEFLAHTIDTDIFNLEVN